MESIDIDAITQSFSGEMMKKKLHLSLKYIGLESKSNKSIYPAPT